MHKVSLKKPDGRDLTLYSARPLASDWTPTNPPHDPIQSEPHLRWHPLRQEWVAYATHRQNRTFLPPKEFNPLAPTRSPDFPTELPAGDYDIAVFDNLFASLTQQAVSAPDLIVPTRPAVGHCEVVVFTQKSDASLASLPLLQVDLLLQVWADRYREIACKRDIRYVLPFENRGVEVGVTLHHPHGQIYSYPFVPPVPALMQKSQAVYLQRNQRPLIADLARQEMDSGERVVVLSASTVAFVPVCARYPYEIWIVPRRPVASLGEMTDDERFDFARVLKAVLMKYDALWSQPFPYLMVLYAAPCDGEPHPEWTFHIEFSPPRRSRDKLKFLAGTELGAGLFINDTVPEQKAAELRQVEVTID